jgi:hypothetical protein
MGKKVRQHIRSNVIGYLALFVALSGTAYAAGTIGSDDIIDESILSQDIKNAEVKNPDLAPDSVGTGKIFDGTVRSADVADDTTDFGLTAQDLEPGSVGTSEVADDSLTGSDIDESTLSIQRNENIENGGGTCNPSSSTFVPCVSAAAAVNAGDRVLVTATGGWFGTNGAGRADTGNCELIQEMFGGSTSAGFPQSLGQAGDQFNSSSRLSGFALTDIFIASLGGTVATYRLRCNQTDGDVQYDDTRITIVNLGP